MMRLFASERIAKVMDTLGFKQLTGKAIISHTIGGLAAGFAANWLYQGAALLFKL